MKPGNIFVYSWKIVDYTFQVAAPETSLLCLCIDLQLTGSEDVSVITNLALVASNAEQMANGPTWRSFFLLF